MIIIASVLAALYIMQIAYYMLGWNKLQDIPLSKDIPMAEFISVVIPVRNDAKALELCLNTIDDWGIDAAHFEVIVVDDHSDDNVQAIIHTFNKTNIQFITLPDDTFSKKAALTHGIQHAKGTLIATLDADGTPCKGWLLNMYAAIKTSNSKLVTGPVLLKQGTTWVENFQVLDNLGMMLITGGSIAQGMPLMANGTNMLFYKEAFTTVDGYTNSYEKASGDDTTLIQKVAAHYGAGSVRFAKSTNAVVYTYAQKTFKGFVQQRQRWAGKAFAFVDKRTTVLLAYNYVYALAVVASVVPICMSMYYIPFLILFFAKAYMDAIIVGQSSRYFKQNLPIGYLYMSLLLHVPYILYIGASGVLKPVDWKGRKV